MDHRHIPKGSSFSSSRWRHFSAKQTSVPQVMQRTGPNISISVVSSLQPGRYSYMKASSTHTHTKVKRSSLSVFVMRGCTSRKGTWYMSVCKDFHWMRELAQSLFCSQCGSCQCYVPSVLRKAFPLIQFPDSDSVLGISFLYTDCCHKFLLHPHGVASATCDQHSHPGTHPPCSVLCRPSVCLLQSAL